jgi:hypothetical protein
MAFRYGGETPDTHYGLELTLESPDGLSESAPQNQRDLFKIGGPAADGTQMKAVPLAAADTPSSVFMVMAKHREAMSDVPGGYKVLTGNPDQIRRVGYVSGAAPTLGQAISASATNLRKVAGIAAARANGLVIAINTGDLEVEVLV